MKKSFLKWIALSTLSILSILSIGLIFFFDLALAADIQPESSLTDPEILNVIVNINNFEIRAGLVARQKAKDSDVRAFAEEMLDTHSQGNIDLGRLEKQIKLRPDSTPLSDRYKKDALEKVKNLKKSESDDFDLDYVNLEVIAHKSALKMIDDQLIPHAKKPQLLTHIKQIKDKLKRQLDDVTKLQSSIKLHQ